MKYLAIFTSILMVGCATLGFGVGGDDEGRYLDQVALELAAAVAIPFYIQMAKDMPEGMSHSDHLRATVTEANRVIAEAFPDLGTFEQILQRRLKDITADKWNPQVYSLYIILYSVLDAVGSDDEAFNHTLLLTV